MDEAPGTCKEDFGVFMHYKDEHGNIRQQWIPLTENGYDAILTIANLLTTRAK